ncbi:hypothetical protein FQN50_004976 [Emmonsiellopsis sp. PD_5]|nr:hypothetical protein FQN50_004976 [Emmonsiellopsis sp. PD_5]
MFENSGIFVTPETGGRNSKVPMQQATTVNTDTPPKLDIFNFSVPSQTENDRLNSPRGGLKQGIGSGIGNNAAVFGKMDDGISVPGKTQERQTRTSLFEPREKYPTDDDDDGSQRKIKEIWKGSMKPLAEPLPKEKNEDGLSSPPSMSQGSFGPPLGPQGGGFGKEKNGDGSSPQQMDLRAQLKGIQAQMAVLMAELGKAQLDAGNKEHHSPTKEETEATDTSLDDDYSLLPPPQRGQDSSDSPPFRPKTDGPPPPSLSLATITTRIDSESDDAKEQDATELDSKITEGNTELSAVTISSPSSKAVDVIWDWAIPHSRLKAPQSFFSIANMLCRHLTKQDQENSGWIYVLKVLDPQGAGRVKVGKSKALTDRIKQHEKCYGECVQLYPPKGMDPEKFKVPHTARVEALIHTELLGWAVALKQCPRQRSRNHGSHREWFELGEDHVITVVNKWIAWMNSGPYEEVRNPLFGFPTNARTPYKEKHWQLKSFSNETLSKLCTPFDSTLPNSWKRIGYVGSKNSE